MKNNKIFKTIKTYNVMEWLSFIKYIEGISEDEFKKYNLTINGLYMLQNTNWYSMVLDLSLRLAPYNQKDIIEIYDCQMIPKYLELISDYINHHDDLESFKLNLESSQNKMISLLMYDQLRNVSPQINSLGRLIVLYDSESQLFKQEIGLSPKQVLIFYHMMSSIPISFKSLTKDEIYNLFLGIDKHISNDNIDKFLDIFSLSIRDYRLKCKELRISKRTIKTSRLVMIYPIIQYNDLYVIPSTFVLLESLSYKIFNKINTTDNRIRSFGDTFEDYIRHMSKHFHENCFFECKDLISDANQGIKKAEFYLKNDDISLVIEAKILHIADVVFADMDMKKIEKKFKNTLNKACKQLDACNNKLENMYSIIVIHTHLPIINVFAESCKKANANKYPWLDKMIVCTVIDYENLISLPLCDIVNKIDELQTSSVNIIDGKENEYLKMKYNEYVEPIIEMYQKEKS